MNRGSQRIFRSTVAPRPSSPAAIDAASLCVDWHPLRANNGGHHARLALLHDTKNVQLPTSILSREEMPGLIDKVRHIDDGQRIRALED